MKIEHKILNSTLEIIPQGGIDMYSCHEFYDFTIKQISANKISKLAINFENVTSIDSSGLGRLFKISKFCDEKNIFKALYNVSNTFLNLFISSGLSALFQIISSEQFEKTFSKDDKIPIKIKLKSTIISILKNSINHSSYLKLAFFIIFIFTILIVEVSTLSIEQSRVNELGSFIKNYLWDIDDLNAKDFSNILIETKGYRKITINHLDGSEFIQISDTDSLNLFSKSLEFLQLIRIYTLSTEIVYNEKKIGTMDILWVNKNLYKHLLIGLVYFLLYNVISAYFKIIQNRRDLNLKNIEINEKMEEVQKLKIQQDGDYFLTSLLTVPLGVVKNVSDKFQITHIIKQKKTFEFKKKKKEIGGDICITERIKLRGNEYIIFINADAMGKSLQGAGGVLVFGSALNSILTRNKNVTISQNVFPEIWLKNTFIDLHKVFETFDGSMLMSTVIGLIEEQSGYMYWINAEHPSTILYRDGKAELIDQDIFLKLGTVGVQRTLYIQHMQLNPGDTIIIGSDGRDDIILGKDANGSNLINEDEKAILNYVEKAKGDLESIYNELKKVGDFSDDLSLLKIVYTQQSSEYFHDERLKSLITQSKKYYTLGNFEESLNLSKKALNEYPDQKDFLKIIIRIYYEKKDYEKISEYIEKYISLAPEDNKFIYLAALTFKKIKNFNLGIAYGERYKLRFPKDINNLFNLYHLYQNNEYYEKAINILNYILELDPQNSKAITLKGGDYHDDFEIH
jgi:anti-anti-sigma factor